jgi:uncharacterized protein YndB with AHSA1/START domain
MADFSTSVDIEAPPDIVFEHLVTADALVTWMGQHAQLDASPGGEFAVNISGDLIRGYFLEVDPPRRVVVSWGMAGSVEFPPGASRVEFTLTATQGGTHVDLVHTGIPESRVERYATGWRHFLSRLREAAVLVAGVRTGRRVEPS